MNNENYLKLGSTIRTCSPDITLKKIHPLIKKIGITRIANITGLDNVGIPVYNCIRPNSKHISVSQGKGTTHELAQISAVMESIESYHAENPQKIDLYGTFHELNRDFELLHPTYLYNGVFKFDDQLFKLGWIKSLNLINNQIIYIPYNSISLDSTIFDPMAILFNTSSNGLATGNCMNEAILHGLYEIIERDELYKFWRRKKKQQLIIESIYDEINSELINKFLCAGLRITVWDITSKLQVPTYYCMIEDNETLPPLGIFGGSGCHLYKEIALSRALLEAAQSRLTYISGSRDEISPKYYKRCHNTNISLKNKHKKKFNYLDYKYKGESFDEDLNEVLNRLKSNNFLRAIIVNHTKAEIGLPVVHAFIPGMRLDC